MKKNWFKNGVHFQCTKCGDCCKGPPPPESVVLVRRAEIRRIARSLSLSEREFRRRFTVDVEGVGVSLVNATGQDHCVFYHPDVAGCLIYDVRPRQCAAFPFWDGNLESKKEWNETARACEGIGRGPLITEEEILGRMFEGMSRT